MLSRETHVSRALAQMVERGELGAKSAQGLRGRYDEDTLAELARRRAATRLAVADPPA